MEHQPNPAAVVAPDGAAVIAAIRAKVIGDRQPIPTIAAALECTERSVYNLIDRYKIPYIKVANRRYADLAAIGAAVLRGEANAAAPGPRKRGRPRKVAV